MTALQARFDAKVQRGPSCWLWVGHVAAGGYGYFRRRGKIVRAHRHAWESAHGPVPPGLYVCHRCDNRRCVRPDHLFLGTALDNARDMRSKGRAPQYEHREHCVRGHALTSENVYVTPRTGLHACRTCRRDLKNASRRRLRAERQSTIAAGWPGGA